MSDWPEDRISRLAAERDAWKERFKNKAAQAAQNAAGQCSSAPVGRELDGDMAEKSPTQLASAPAPAAPEADAQVSAARESQGTCGSSEPASSATVMVQRVREYICANLLDGCEDGEIAMSSKDFLDEVSRLSVDALFDAPASGPSEEDVRLAEFVSKYDRHATMREVVLASVVLRLVGRSE